MWPFSSADARRALIVEDDVGMRTMLGVCLGGIGWQVTETSNGLEGMAAALERPPKLVLLDLAMPLMDGSDVLVQLRANPKTAKAVIIIVTANGALDDIDRLLSLGANDYLTKPFEFSQLKDKVARYFPPEAA